MREICETCKFAELGVTGPSPSNKDDGVNCQSLEYAQLLDRVYGYGFAEQEFKEYG